MKRFLRKIFPLLMAAAIIFSIGWYLLVFDPAFTRDLLLQQAVRFENNGKHTAAVWCYQLAYKQLDGSDEVAIEMAQQFKEIGNYSKAEYTLRKALEDGGSKALYKALCKTYVQQGKLRDAVLLLDNANEALRHTLDELRPAPPTASLESGSYNQYLSVELRCDGCKLYVSTDGDYPNTKTDAYTGPIQLQAGETTIYALCVDDSGMVSSLAVFHYIVSNVVEEVTLADPAFEAAIRQILGLDQHQSIYSNDLWLLTDVSLPAEVTSFVDLKWLQGLEKLTILSSSIDTLAALPELAGLKELTIRDGILSMEHLASIGAVNGLQRLTLSNCAISTVAPLSELTDLQYLDLSENAIRDLSGLSEMTELEHLDLRGNALINLEGLEKLTKLSYLDVSYNSLSDIRTVENMQALSYLNLSSNNLRSLDGVAELENLTHFIASHNELLDVEALEGCQSLVYLDVSNNTLLNVNVTASLLKLQELYFDHNEVEKLPKYSKNCSLVIISGSYNLLSSLNNLAGLNALEYIYMDYNTELSNIASLANCPELKEVYVYGTKVRSVSKLIENDIYVVYTPG